MPSPSAPSLTPSNVFARMVPWLVLFATAAFAYGSFGRKPAAAEDGSGGLGPLADAGLIVEWPNIADRMIEEMR